MTRLRAGLVCRVAFAFVYVLTAYVCFLLLKYYQAYAILRQRYMTGGEGHDQPVD